ILLITAHKTIKRGRIQIPKIPYPPLSTQHQTLHPQIHTLKHYPSQPIFTQKLTPPKTKTTQLHNSLHYLPQPHILLIYKLHPLPPTTKQLIHLSQSLHQNPIHLHIIHINLSTKHPIPKIFFTIITPFPQLQPNLLTQPTKKPLQPATAR
ncbi:recombinase family protein, partial [Staphylococcus saprophyticus]|uniref:recombinase family protein n=1 Tax=Staphylococcus saprophyticus TaxID=29385 RepID=UPI00164244D2